MASAHPEATTAGERGTRRRARACLLLVAVLALGACSHGVRLSDPDRASLAGQPAIHVLHYETPLPRLKTLGKATLPTPAAIRRHAGADPADLIAQHFARLLGKKEKLGNLQVEARHLSPPVAKSASEYKGKYRRGLALDLWVDDWAFEAIAGEPGSYAMRLTARARLARIDDGRALWSTGRCSVGGSRDLRLSGADLATGTKLRRLLNNARDECVRQLTRDFYSREETR